ncbi:MAG: FtsX-like permease family protein [Bryobacteraceae bacterium]
MLLSGLAKPVKPQIIMPFGGGNYFAVRYSIPVQQAIREIRTALRSLDPTLAPDNMHTMGDRIDRSNARRRFQTALLTGFAGLAVFLALAGLYAVMSYSVKRRTAEIGIRMALGSPRSRVLRLILSRGLGLTALGLLIGLGGAFALTQIVSSWLFGIQPTDPVTFVLVPVFILAVACLACLIPAWNATRIDPIRTLRQE